MACCGSSSSSTKRYRLTAPDGSVHIYLTDVEARIAAHSLGGGTIDVVWEEKK